MDVYSPIIPALKLESIKQPYHEAIRTCHRLDDGASSPSKSDNSSYCQEHDQIGLDMMMEMPDFLDNEVASLSQFLPCHVNPNSGSATARAVRPKFDSDFMRKIPETSRISKGNSEEFEDYLRMTQYSQPTVDSLNVTATSSHWSLQQTLLNDTFSRSSTPEKDVVASTPIIVCSEGIVREHHANTSDRTSKRTRLRRFVRKLFRR